MYKLLELIDSITTVLNLVDFEGEIQLQGLRAFLRLPDSVFSDLDKPEIDKLLAALQKAIDLSFWTETKKATSEELRYWIDGEAFEGRVLEDRFHRVQSMKEVHKLQEDLVEKLSRAHVSPEVVSEIGAFLEAIGMELARINLNNQVLEVYSYENLDDLLNGPAGNKFINPVVNSKEDIDKASKLLRMREILFLDIEKVVSEIHALKPEQLHRISPMIKPRSLFQEIYRFYQEEAIPKETTIKGFATLLSRPEVLSALAYTWLDESYSYNPIWAPINFVIVNLLECHPDFAYRLRASNSPIRLLSSLFLQGQISDEDRKYYTSSLVLCAGQEAPKKEPNEILLGLFNELDVILRTGHPWEKKWAYLALARLISYQNKEVIERFYTSGLFSLIHEQFVDPTNANKIEIMKFFSAIIVHMSNDKAEEMRRAALHAIYHDVVDPSVALEYKIPVIEVLIDVVHSKSERAEAIKHELLDLGLVKDWIELLDTYADNGDRNDEERFRGDLVKVLRNVAAGDDLIKTRLAPLIDLLFNVLHIQRGYHFYRGKSQEEAMCALWNIACGPDEQKLQIATQFGEILDKTLNDGFIEFDILKSSLGTFRMLTTGSQYVKSALMPTISQLLAWFDKRHYFGERISELHATVAAALWNLADGGAHFQLALLNEGTIPVLLTQFSKSNHSSAELDRCLGGALKRLCALGGLEKSHQMALKKQLCEERSVERLLSWLTDRDESRVKLALDIFYHLTYLDYQSADDPISVALEAELPTFIRLVGDASRSSNVRQISAGLLWHLAGTKGPIGHSIKQQLLDLELVPQWLLMLVDKTLPAPMKTELVGVLRALSTGDSSIKMRLIPIIDPLFDCLSQADETVLDVKREAINVLWNLSSGSPELQQRIADRLHQVFEKMLSSPPIDVDLLRGSLGVLRQLSLGDKKVKLALLTNVPLLLKGLSIKPEADDIKTSFYATVAAILWNLADGGPKYQLALLNEGAFPMLLSQFSQSDHHDAELDRCLQGALKQLCYFHNMEKEEKIAFKTQLCREGSVQSMLTWLSDPDESKVNLALSTFLRLTDADYEEDNLVRLALANGHDMIFRLSHEESPEIAQNALVLCGNLLCNAKTSQKRAAIDAYGPELIRAFLNADSESSKYSLSWVLTNLLCDQFEYMQKLCWSMPDFCDELLEISAHLPDNFGPQDRVYVEKMAAQLQKVKTDSQAIVPYSFFAPSLSRRAFEEEITSVANTHAP